MKFKNQYQFRASKEETVLLVQQIVDLEHKDDLSRKLTGACGKSGNFVFTLRRLASGGAPTYSPQLIGKIEGDHKNSSIHIRFRPSLVIVFFAALMCTIITVLFYKHYIIEVADGKSFMFAILSIVILGAVFLGYFHLKRELKRLFLTLILDEETKQLNNLY